MRVAGIDACSRGWVAVVLEQDGDAAGVYAKTLDELLPALPGVQGFAVDIPIGLATKVPRRADVEAKRFLGPRHTSVFLTPIREAVLATSHAEATSKSKRITGKGVSQQAFALAPKILEAEAWTRQLAVPVWEVHPEVSFAMLLGQPAMWRKKSWAGMRERVQVLRGAGIELDDLGEAGTHAGVDDVLDAAAAAWSAARLVGGNGQSFPSPPERDPVTGREIAIWV